MRFYIVFFLFSILASVAIGKNERIIGGDYTDIRTYPYMAAFRYLPPNLTFCCGAIISHKHILTAAHCLFRDEHRFHIIRIYTGMSDTHKTEGPTHEIAEAVFHPEFTGEDTSQDMNGNDIAVVKIRGYIEFNDFQKKIDLPTSDIRHNQDAILAGWGMVSFPDMTPPPKIKVVPMVVLHRLYCARVIPRNLHKDQFCAFFAKGIGPCSGDSGAPLVSEGKVIGVVSFNIPCAIGIPDIYTNVYAYLDFINSALNR